MSTTPEEENSTLRDVIKSLGEELREQKSENDKLKAYLGVLGFILLLALLLVAASCLPNTAH